jgi:hypothetical protein
MAFLSSSGFLGLTWLQWLWMYPLPGLIYSAHHLYQDYKARPSQFAKDILRAIGQEKSLRERLLNILVYVIAITAMAFVWPGFLVWGVLKARKDKAREFEEDVEDFECAPEYLVAKVDPVDAEITSYVIDPLNKVPPLPFGHLNAAWGNFLSEMLDPAEELWSFYIPKGSACGLHSFSCSGEMRGYAKVRNGKILGEFITESD